MVPACVVDDALKEYLRTTRGEIRCNRKNLFIFRVLWYWLCGCVVVWL